jgi:hypothetical protein
MMQMTYATSLSASTMQICDARFSSADEKFNALVAASKREGFEFRDRISHYTGTFDLSQAEQEMFGIDLDELHGVRWAYERYISLIGCVDAYFGDYAEQERKDHAKYFKSELSWSFDDAYNFMAIVCSQSAVQSMAWICNIVAAELRGGIHYDIERDAD